MAVLPRPIVGTYGSGTQNGFMLYDNSLDQIAAQGAEERRTRQPELQNQLTLGQLAAGTDRYRTDVGAATDRSGQQVVQQGNQLAADTARRGQDLQFQASQAPVNLARDKFNSVFPLFSSVIDGGGAFGGGGGGGFQAVGGQNTPTPGVTVGGVYSPQQIREQVNAGQAGNAGRAATQSRQIAETGGARGMAASSPLLAALQGQVQAARMAADADVAREVPFQAAQANAEQQSRSEALRGQLWGQENELDIRRRQNVLAQQSALLSALAGLI